MKTRKFSYNKWRLFLDFFVALLWIFITISDYFELKTVTLNMVVYGLASLLFLMAFIVRFLNGYIEIYQDEIRIQSLPKKRIYIRDLIEIRVAPEDIILRTKEKSYKISKLSIDKSQYEALDLFMKDLNEAINQKS